MKRLTKNLLILFVTIIIIALVSVSLNYWVLSGKTIMDRTGLSANLRETESSPCLEQSYYLVEGILSSKNFSVVDISLENGCFNRKDILDTKLTSEGERIFFVSLRPFFYSDGIDNLKSDEISGNVEEYEGDFVLTIPLLEEADSFILEDTFSGYEIRLYPKNYF